MLFAGSVPLVLYLLEAEAFNVSVVELLALSVVLGSMVHYLSIRIGRRSSERPHGSQSWAYAAASAVIAAYLILDVSRFGPVVFRYPSVLIRTVFWADQLDPFFFVNKSVLWLTAIGLYAVTRIETREEGAARRIYYGLLFQGITFAVIFLGDLYHKGVSLSEHLLQNSQHNLPGLFTLFREHNTFAAFWLIQAVLVAGSMFARPAWQRIAAFVLFAFYSLLVLLSLSLSAIMGYAAALAAGVVVIRRGAVGSFSSFSWKKWRLPAAILVLATLALGTYWLRGRTDTLAETVQTRVEMITPGNLVESIYEHRLYPWRIAGVMIRDSPVFGIGLGRFYLMFAEYREKANLRTEDWFWSRYRHENAHNYFVQIAAEAGLLGLLLLLLFLAGLFRRLDSTSIVSGSAGVAVFGVAVNSLSQHTLLVESIFLTVAVLCALVPALKRDNGPLGRHVSRGVARSGAVVLLALYLWHFAAVWGRMPERFEYGVYQTEKEGGLEYRWLSDLALVRQDWASNRQSGDTRGERQFLVRGHNPDIGANPLVVTVEQDGRPLAKLALADHLWHPMTLPLDRWGVLALQCSRPLEAPGEVRRLGVAVAGLPVN